MLRHYLEAIVSRHTPLPQSLTEPATDVFMAEVLRFLERKGINLYFTNYPIAGMEIDLVIIHKGQTYCIDLIGYPGAFQSSPPIERWKMLDRIGLCSFTLPYSQWHFHRVKCEQALLQFLNF
ncbi:MAG: NERD domain-containing protein [Saprospiraceae bacterium]